MPYKILTVDDSLAVRMLVKKSFRAFDVDILQAKNGEEGLSMASSEMPDLIVLDITMPVMDGIKMLTALKSDEALKGIPVIMLTAEAGRETVLHIAKLGVSAYVVKPFKEEKIIEEARRFIDLQPKN